MLRFDGERTAGFKLFLTIVVGLALTIPLFSVYLLNYDRQSQQQEATRSITEGWGGPQAMAGPVLVIPYRANATETLVQNGQSVTRTNQVKRELTLAPEAVAMSTDVKPEVRKRSIYEAVVYDARVSGKARFDFPPDLARTGVDPAAMDLTRAELRFGLGDPRGLGANPRVSADGQPLRLQPGGGSGGGRGFFAWIDASSLAGAPIAVDFAYEFRGNASLSLAPQAGRYALDGPLVLAEPELRRRLPARRPPCRRQRIRRDLSNRQPRARPLARDHRRCRRVQRRRAGSAAAPR